MWENKLLNHCSSVSASCFSLNPAAKDMDAVEIMLFCLVGLSVSVFLVLDNLEKGRRRKARRREAEAKGLVPAVSSSPSSSVKEDYFPQDERRVGGHDEAETRFTSQSCNKAAIVAVREIEEENEEQEPILSDNEISEKSGLLSHNDGGEEREGEKDWLDYDDDDWEGVERSELEKVFGEALAFVGCAENADQIGDEQRLELYGLEKVALQGSCSGSQPMALHVSARSKWNAWQKLGNMSRETAMEKYVDVLSQAIPGWKMHIKPNL